MRCDICGKNQAVIRKESKTYGDGKNMFIVEDVPIVSCRNCGESYLTAETLHEIERIKHQKKSSFKKQSIPVIQYA